MAMHWLLLHSRSNITFNWNSFEIYFECYGHFRAGVSNSRPGGRIRPVTSLDVAPQELGKNIICLLYVYMPIYRSTLPMNYMSHNASQIGLFSQNLTCFSESEFFSFKIFLFSYNLPFSQNLTFISKCHFFFNFFSPEFGISFSIILWHSHWRDSQLFALDFCFQA